MSNNGIFCKGDLQYEKNAGYPLAGHRRAGARGHPPDREALAEAGRAV